MQLTTSALRLLSLLLLLSFAVVSPESFAESSPYSSIIRVNNGTRRGHLLGLQGLTDNGQVSAGLLFNDVAVFLAYQHFNERRGDILPHLPSLLEGCDFYMTYESRDTQRTALHGADQLIQAMTTNTTQQKVPFAYFGAHLSSVSKPLSTIGAAFDLPQISGASTSSELDSAPLFARTISTNEADARGILVYLQHIGIRYVAHVYLHNEWGIYYNTALRKYAREMNIRLLSVPFDNTPESINSAMEDLKKSQYRYVFASVNPWQDVFRAAYKHGVLGNKEYVWFAGEFSISEGTQYNRTTDHDLAMALDGIGTINHYQEAYPAMDAALQKITTNITLQQEYFQHLVDPTIVQNFTLQTVAYSHAFRHYTNFDAVIALGLAACNAPNPLFTGPQLYQQLLQTEFDGTSGRVSLNSLGNRQPTTVQFRIEYLQLLSDEDYYRFETHVAALVKGDDFTEVAPFVYHNNRTTAVPDLPPREGEELHAISYGVQWFGYCLAILSLTLSVVCLVWSIVYRGIFVVRAAQPVFLVLLCVGTFLIGSAIIPLSFPGAHTGYEGTKALDVACMLPVWLVVLGFVIAFSSIHAKTWRMLKIMKSAHQMIRTQVQPQDVILPFLMMLTINVVLLLCITILAPFTFERVPMASWDEFGRSIESYATCNYFSNGDALPYFVPLLVVDFLWLVLVVCQAYQARNLSTAFSESKYLQVTLMSLFETFVLGFPILVAVKDDPTAFYICASLFLALSVAAVLIPIFLPKYMHRKIERGRSAIQRNTESGTGQRFTGQSGAGSKAKSAHSHATGLDQNNGHMTTPTRASVPTMSSETPPTATLKSVPGESACANVPVMSSQTTATATPPSTTLQSGASTLPSSMSSQTPPTTTLQSSRGDSASSIPSSMRSISSKVGRPSQVSRHSRESQLSHPNSESSRSGGRHSAFSRKKESPQPRGITIMSRDDSWHFEDRLASEKQANAKQATENNKPISKVPLSNQQTNNLGMDKHELEALDLVKDVDLENLDNQSDHSRKTC